MKNLLLIAALLVSLVPCAGAQVDRSREKNFAVPTGAYEGGSDVDAKWSIAASSFRDFNTAATAPATGKILVRAVCATSTNTAGGYVALYDTIVVTGLTVTSGVGTFVAAFAARGLSSNGTDTAKPSCEWFPRGLPFQNGLAWLTSHADVRATVIYDKIRN